MGKCVSIFVCSKQSEHVNISIHLCLYHFLSPNLSGHLIGNDPTFFTKCKDKEVCKLQHTVIAVGVILFNVGIRLVSHLIVMVSVCP